MAVGVEAEADIMVAVEAGVADTMAVFQQPAAEFHAPHQVSAPRVRVLPPQQRSARRAAQRQRLARRCRTVPGPTAKPLRQAAPGRRRAARSCQYAQLGQPPERRQSPHRQSCESWEPGLRREPADQSATTSTSIASNNFAGQTHANWNGAISTVATGTTGIGTATGTTAGIIISRWAGGRAGTGPAPPFPRFPGPGDIIRTTTPTTAVRSSMAVQ